jgi:hypothetical protein
MAQQYPIFQHRDGGVYLKLCEAIHTENNEPLTIYACAASGEVFARPTAMFNQPGRFTAIPYITDKATRKKLRLVP